MGIYLGEEGQDASYFLIEAKNEKEALDKAYKRIGGNLKIIRKLTEEELKQSKWRCRIIGCA